MPCASATRADARSDLWALATVASLRSVPSPAEAELGEADVQSGLCTHDALERAAGVIEGRSSRTGEKAEKALEQRS